jgi:hypothetical protein
LSSFQNELLKYLYSNCSKVQQDKLPCLPVSVDQFSLATTNWYKTVHSFDSSLHRFFYRNSWDNTGGFCSYTSSCLAIQWTLKFITIYSTLSFFLQQSNDQIIQMKILKKILYLWIGLDTGSRYRSYTE